mmetsp:Transcript_68824/g.165208  ORF Transcript_68824/g.165208 Transcript_68824/m.165208 type:complete len:468 (+) Transcript_68824:69-1472(+)
MALPAELRPAWQPDLQKYCRVEPALSLDELKEVKALLLEKKTLDCSKAKVKDATGKATGTFSASAPNATGDHMESSMFGSWLRDNALIAYALYVTDPSGPGSDDAVACISSIADFMLRTQSFKIEMILAGKKNVQGAEETWMDRPHIRFLGATGQEDPKWYNHKQNDALGYFMFARSVLALGGKMPMTGDHLKLLGQLFDYLVVIKSWDDLDGGHWEEHSAQHASSLGPCLAAVRVFKQLCTQKGYLAPCKADTLDVLEANLTSSLAKILPNEIITPAELYRDSDAATIFLCYPLAVVDEAMGRQILERMKKVYGHIGICRYRKDSYWCRDYKDTQDDPTKHFTDEELKARDALLKPGEEAQWNLFDPVVSCYYGRLFQKTKAPEDLKCQQLFLARCLSAITGNDCEFGPWHACEAYYICKDKWVPNDDTPLVWTQAMLLLAFDEMEESLSVAAGKPNKKRPAECMS